MNENNASSRETRQLQVWACADCEAIHLKTENEMLNFTRAEFADLTHAVMEIYQNEFGSLEFCDLVGFLKQRDARLITQSVS